MKQSEIKTCDNAGHLITSAIELEEISAKIAAVGRVAVDTEFVWERTYYPNLGIVQLALNEKEAWLLDILALKGKLDTLGKVLSNPQIEKILHDARQDLTILRQATGFYPQNIFDTRLAAGFIGPSASLSLLDTCSLFAGITLEKGETRSDWLKRPLTANQHKYALDDVLFLPLIRDEIISRAEKLGRGQWLAEEMQLYDNPDLYNDPDPEQIYIKVKGASRLTRPELAILRSVTAWRERKACARNRPRRHIIADEPLIKIARNAPQNDKELTQSCGLSLRAGQRYGQELLQAVATALAVPETDWPTATGKSRNSRNSEKIRSILDLIAEIGKSHNLDPALIATRKDIEKIFADKDQVTRTKSQQMPGWRRHLLGEKITKHL